jgi:hypothetical protein
MKKFFVILSLTVLVLSFLTIQSAKASTLWSEGHYNKTMAYSYPGASWGSVEYDLTQWEEWEWIYSRANSDRRQINLQYYKNCPYTCELYFANYYYNSSDWSYITGQSQDAMEGGVYWATYQDANAYHNDRRSPYGITADYGNHLKSVLYGSKRRRLDVC